ncbi:hypothetical protein FRC19_011139 [Serendipita sp. 401]|nr:hypothetical protein FRC19_011139 [Serendipita sp. 401]KAG9049860.1 hypothetical protein FS842_011476 [Serendipita sp. 407]
MDCAKISSPCLQSSPSSNRAVSALCGGRIQGNRGSHRDGQGETASNPIGKGNVPNRAAGVDIKTAKQDAHGRTGHSLNPWRKVVAARQTPLRESEFPDLGSIAKDVDNASSLPSSGDQSFEELIGICSAQTYADRVRLGKPSTQSPLSRVQSSSAFTPASTSRRQTARIDLAPSTLLPYVQTGAPTSRQYNRNRAQMFHHQNNRNSNYVQAHNAYLKKGSAGASTFSKVARQHGEIMKDLSKTAAQRQFWERQNELSMAARQCGRGGPHAGKLIGAQQGVLLGTAPSGRSGPGKSSSESEEAAVDLHGLHANEVADVLEMFFPGLIQERFLGLGE